MEQEECNALTLAFRLHQHSVDETNKIMNDYRERLEKENKKLREENSWMKAELEELHYALAIIRGDRQRCY